MGSLCEIWKMMADSWQLIYINITKTYSKTTTLFLLGRSQVDSISNHNSIFVAEKFSNAFCSWGAFSTNTWKYKKKKDELFEKLSSKLSQTLSPKIVLKIVPKIVFKLSLKLSPKLTTKLSTDFVRQNCPWNCSRNYPKNCHKRCPKTYAENYLQNCPKNCTFVAEKFNNALCFWGAFSTNTLKYFKEEDDLAPCQIWKS